MDSPCRDKLCVLEGAFSKPGKWAACLPNRVFVSIKGIKTEDTPIDDTSY